MTSKFYKTNTTLRIRLHRHQYRYNIEIKLLLDLSTYNIHYVDVIDNTMLPTGSNRKGSDQNGIRIH